MRLNCFNKKKTIIFPISLSRCVFLVAIRARTNKLELPSEQTQKLGPVNDLLLFSIQSAFFVYFVLCCNLTCKYFSSEMRRKSFFLGFFSVNIVGLCLPIWKIFFPMENSPFYLLILSTGGILLHLKYFL